MKLGLWCLIAGYLTRARARRGVRNPERNLYRCKDTSWVARVAGSEPVTSLADMAREMQIN